MTLTVLRDAADRVTANLTELFSVAEASEIDTSGGLSLSKMVPTAVSGDPITPPTALVTSSMRISIVSLCSSAVSAIVNTLTVADIDPAGMTTW